MKKHVWEILVPANDNSVEIPLAYHKLWDKKVECIAGGLTVLKSAKGTWRAPDGSLYNDKMIPVRIICTKEQMNQIMDMTMTHYKSELIILCYRISNFVMTRTRKG